MAMYRTRLGFSVVLAMVVGCSGAAAGRGTTVASVHPPAQVTTATYKESVRLFESMAVDSPERAPLRQRILTYLAGQTAAIDHAGDYDAMVEHFAAMTALLSPDDFSPGNVPSELDAPARAILTRARPLGDEARAMSALLVLHLLHPNDATFGRDYQVVAKWGREVRATLPNPIERYSRLIDVWEEHARLTPAPSVLENLAQLYIRERNVVVAAMRSGEGLRVGGPFGPDIGLAPAQLLRQAPFEVAAVYLAHGDVAQAISHVRGMGQVTDVEAQLLNVLHDARGQGTQAADAIAQLAEAYREVRPDVASGLCRLGLHEMPKDPAFPACLARVAAEEQHYADATAWYADAIDLAPSQRKLYDEALAKINDFIERGLFDSDPIEARRLAGKAEQILDQRMKRWPNAPSPVGREQLSLLIGTLEMNAGNVDEARRHLEQSLQEKQTPQAMLQLAMLDQRTGHARSAEALYRRALDSMPDKGADTALKRAEILQQLADTLRQSGQEAKAIPLYQQVLPLLDQVAPQASGPSLALVQVQRGIALDRLGKRAAAVTAFTAAMAAAPHWRETYAGVLSHLAVASPADAKLALQVFRRAQRQLTLKPEWKVYFALWVGLVAGRAGVAPDPDVRALLAELGSGTAWWANLAKFGAGSLPYDELLGDASTVGQHAEAYFYEGARRLETGDRSGAKRMFEQVLTTHMVSFYEYSMAQELLSSEAPSTPKSTPSSP